MTTATGPQPTITGAAGQMALRVVRQIRARADAARHGEDGTWRNRDVLRAFLAVADHIVVTVEHPHPDRPRVRVITATAPATHHGMLWAYIAQDAMRRACPDGDIRNTGPHTYTLTLTED